MLEDNLKVTYSKLPLGVLPSLHLPQVVIQSVHGYKYKNLCPLGQVISLLDYLYLSLCLSLFWT